MMQAFGFITLICCHVTTVLAQLPSIKQGRDCEYEVVDSLDNILIKECADNIKSSGRDQAQKLIELHKQNMKLTLAEPAIVKVLDLPTTFVECTFKKLNLVSGDRGSYKYNKDQFVGNPNLPDVVSSCSKKTPGVCPFKDLSMACLPHPIPLLKCVRQNIFKPCTAIQGPVLPTLSPTVNKVQNEEEDDEEGNEEEIYNKNFKPQSPGLGGDSFGGMGSSGAGLGPFSSIGGMGNSFGGMGSMGGLGGPVLPPSKKLDLDEEEEEKK